MMPIHKLLNELRWDPQYAGSRFTIGYEDHVRGMVHVPLERVTVLPGSHFMFEVPQEDGQTSTVPLHRVRQVLRDDRPFWERRVERSAG